MLRLEKIKEFKNLNAISRIIYSERHGMILSIPGGESGMKVHSFATGKRESTWQLRMRIGEHTRPRVSSSVPSPKTLIYTAPRR
jgi:hypothetical protein